MKKKVSGGLHYYRKAGLTKGVIVHLTPELHKKLMKIADNEDRSLQVTIRRILEAYAVENS